MKKYFLSFFLILVFVFYILLGEQNSFTIMAQTDNNTSSSSVAQNDTSTSITITTSSTGTTPPTKQPTSTPTTPAGQYKDGTYTGPVADAIYGKLQVVAVIQGGAITDVQFPVFPNSPGHTTQVNDAALPTLKQEAIQSQNAKVDIVSGATQTSEAFQQSLAAALAMAKS